MIQQTRHGAVAASLGTLLFGAFLAGCPARAYDNQTTLPSPALLTVAETERQRQLKVNGISRGEVEFTFQLLKKTVEQAPNANVFLSPFSASQAVLLAANGTTDGTQAAFLESVGLAGGDISLINRDKKALLALLQPATEKDSRGKSVPAYEWTVANAVWSRYEPKAAYVKTCADYLGATAEPLTTAAAINSWADTNTRGRIKNIVTDQTVQNADLVLTNAVYFKGRWVSPFETFATRDAPFHLPNGTKRQQPFMNDTSHGILWCQGKNFDAVSLPYRGGTSMVILLPSPSTRTVTEMLQSFTAADWNTLRTNLRPSYIQLALPKFEINYETSLLKPLTELGMPTAGDFSPVSDRLTNSFLSDVIQKTFLRVDEKGTEAAGVTGIGVAGAAAPVREEPHPFIVDHPFLCAIIHDDTGVILFAGIINDPKPLQ